jgi:hypothetical protein
MRWAARATLGGGSDKCKQDFDTETSVKETSLYLCVSYDSHCKQGLFPQTALTS